MLKTIHRVLISVKSDHISIKKTMCSSAKCDKNVLKQLFLESVKAVQPHELIKNQIRYEQRHLEIKSQTFVLNKPCYVVGFGKAVLGMAIEIEKILGTDLERALVSVPNGIFKNLKITIPDSSKIEFTEGAQDNLPDEDAMEGAKKIRDLVEKLQKDDFLIVLISGGGSALLPFPIPPITLAQKQVVIKKLGQNGADINELNTVRKQLSLLKGGKLAELAYPANVVSLILSDVVGDPLDIIASGPTVQNRTTVEDAIEILKKYLIYEEIPESVKTVLEIASENADGKYQARNHVTNYIIGNNKIATSAAKQLAEKLGFQCVVLSHQIEGDVEDLGRMYADFAKHVDLMVRTRNYQQPFEGVLKSLPWKTERNSIKDVLDMDFAKQMVFIFAGEPTVVVKGHGKGGRNQQLALSFSLQLNNLEISSCYISFLSAGTDGIDGPTDAAGALGHSKVIHECNKQNLDVVRYLENSDSYGLYSKLNHGEFLIKIGHSGTNVMDVHFLKIVPNKL